MSSSVLLWLPTLIGIGIVLGFTIYAVGLRVEEPGYEIPAEAGHSEGLEASPTPTPSPEPEETSPPPAEPPPPPPPSPDVVSKYKLKESFEDVFIGKVVIVNQSDHAQDWTLVLAFPDNVGKLLDFWVEGAEQPQLQVVDNRHTFTSTAPIGTESHVVLKAKFARSGPDVDPDICEVNSSHCLI